MIVFYTHFQSTVKYVLPLPGFTPSVEAAGRSYFTALPSPWELRIQQVPLFRRHTLSLSCFFSLLQLMLSFFSTLAGGQASQFSLCGAAEHHSVNYASAPGRLGSLWTHFVYMEINYLVKGVKNDSEAMVCILAWEQPILGNVTDPGMQ